MKISEYKARVMSTDLHIIVLSEHDVAIVDTYRKIQAFEKRFSRFIEDSELSTFNQQSGQITVSEDMFNMLELALNFKQFTNGIFDICTLPNLLHQGYTHSIDAGFISDQLYAKPVNLGDIQIINQASRLINKPEGTLVDLGGIGKSYIIAKISADLAEHYENFLINIGGDIYIHGKDTFNKYDYWCIDIADPYDENVVLASVILSDMAIATSSTIKRSWHKDNVKKNHLIDTRTGESTLSDLVSVSVVSNDIIFADVLAKSLLIMGTQAASEFCKENKISAFLVDNKLKYSCTYEMEKYIWNS